MTSQLPADAVRSGRSAWQVGSLTAATPKRCALIRVGHRCNNNCIFCHLENRDSASLQNDVIRRKLLRARQLGYSLVAFSGGEPTLQRDLLSWAGSAQSLGLGVGLVTNGRMLAYESFVDAFVRAGLVYAHVSLHAGDEELHDSLVRARAFAQTLRGIQLLAARGVDLSVGCVVTSLNMHALRRIVDILAPLGQVRLKFALVEPKGAVLELPDALPANVAAAAERVRDAIEYGVGNSRLRLAHEGFPLCLLPAYENLAEGLRSHGFIAMSNVGEPDFYPVEPEMRAHPKPCDDCGLRGRCAGVHEHYLRRDGYAALRPVVCQRSNSFTYTPVRKLEWPVGAACPVYADGGAPYHPARNLFVRQAGVVTQFETATNDFADDELGEAVHQRGQVYFDRGTKLAPNDFANDIQALCRSTACDGCPKTEQCPGLLEISDRSPFQYDDEYLRHTLAQMRGSVLDVGCGTGRYLTALMPAVLAGQLQYTGVDPDASTLTRLQQVYPWAVTRHGCIEELTLPAGSFDNVTMIGSVNHIRDLNEVLARLSAALRPGGSLLLADDVPFGLLRSTTHDRQCRSSSVGFEHFRVEDSQRVRSRLVKLPVTIVDERRVGRSTSNQWLVRAVRN